jgi:hypothetical protein
MLSPLITTGKKHDGQPYIHERPLLPIETRLHLARSANEEQGKGLV